MNSDENNTEDNLPDLDDVATEGDPNVSVQNADAESELRQVIASLLDAGVSDDDITVALDKILTERVGEDDDGFIDTRMDADGDPAPTTAAAATDPGFTQAQKLGHVKGPSETD